MANELSPTTITDWDDNPEVSAALQSAAFSFRQGNIGSLQNPYSVGNIRVNFTRDRQPTVHQAISAEYSVVVELHSSGVVVPSRALPGFSASTLLDDFTISQPVYVNFNESSGLFDYSFIDSVAVNLRYIGNAARTGAVSAKVLVWAAEEQSSSGGVSLSDGYNLVRFELDLTITITDTPDGPFNPTATVTQAPTSLAIREHVPGRVPLGILEFNYLPTTPSGFDGGVMPPFGVDIVASSSNSKIQAEIAGIIRYVPFNGGNAVSRVRVAVVYVGRGENYESGRTITSDISVRTGAYPAMRTAAYTATQSVTVNIGNRNGDPWPITSSEFWWPSTGRASLREETAGPVQIAIVQLTFSSTAGRVPAVFTASIGGQDRNNYSVSSTIVGGGTDAAGRYMRGLQCIISYIGSGEDYSTNTSDNISLSVNIPANNFRGTAAYSNIFPIAVTIQEADDTTPITPPPTPPPDTPDPEPPDTPDTPTPEPEEPTTASPKPVRNPFTTVPTAFEMRVGDTRTLDIENHWLYREGGSPSWSVSNTPASVVTFIRSNSVLNLTARRTGTTIFTCRSSDGGETSDTQLYITITVIAASVDEEDVDEGTDTAGIIQEFVPTPVVPGQVKATIGFFRPKIRGIPEGLDAANNRDTAAGRDGFLVGWITGIIRTSGTWRGVGFQLQGADASKFRLGTAISTIPGTNSPAPAEGGSSEDIRMPIFYIGSGEDRDVRRYVQFRVLGRVGGTTTASLITEGGTGTITIPVPIVEVSRVSGEDLFELVDAIIPGQKDLQTKAKLDYESSRLNAIAVRAHREHTNTSRGGDIAFLMKQIISNVEDKPYRVQNPPPLDYQLKPRDSDKTGDLFAFWTRSDGTETTGRRVADYWYYSDSYSRRVFKDDEGDAYAIKAVPSTNNQVWFSAQVLSGADEYKVAYTTQYPFTRNPATDINLSQQLQAEQPVGTVRADAEQAVNLKRYAPAPISTPSRNQNIVIPASTDTHTVDVASFLHNPDDRPYISFIEGLISSGQIVGRAQGRAGIYEVGSDGSLICTRRTINGVKQTDNSGELVPYIFQVGNNPTLQRDRRRDLGDQVAGTVFLNIIWAEALALRSLIHRTPISPGLIYVDATATSGTIDLTARAVANPGNRPLVADNGTRGMVSWDVAGGSFQVERPDGAGSNHLVLRFSRGDSFPFAQSPTTFETLVTIRTNDAFPESSLQQRIRVRLERPSS